MDVQTIDQEFNQLQQEANLVAQTIDTFAGKLKTAGDGGDANAQGWLLDLKGIALQIQQEQLQVQSLLQALHDFVVNNAQTSQAPAPAPAPAPVQAAPVQAEVAQSEAQPKSGIISRFMGGGFGQAVATGAGMGAGFGVTESVINDIFN